MTDMVKITVERYEELCKDQMLLNALLWHGVDDWERYPDAVDLCKKWIKEEQE